MEHSSSEISIIGELTWVCKMSSIVNFYDLLNVLTKY